MTEGRLRKPTGQREDYIRALNINRDSTSTVEKPLMGVNKGRWINFLILVIGIGMGGILVEGYFYFFFPQKTTAYRKQDRHPIFEYGKDLPKRIIPNLTIVDFHDLYREFSNTIITDRFGFRRARTDPIMPSVVILGDSQTFGHGVSNDEAYPNVLDEMFPDCQIINAAVPGTELNYYYAYLRKIVEENILQDLRRVVVGLTMPGNDFTGTMEVDRALTAYRCMVVKNRKVVYNKCRVNPNHLRTKINFLLSYSQAYTFLRINWWPWFKWKFFMTYEDQESYKQVMLAQYRQPLEPVKTLIERMHRFATKHGIGLTFVFLPDRPRYFSKPPRYLKLVQDYMNENGIEHIDLVPPLKTHYRRLEDYWLPFNGHYNKAGHRIIAELLATHPIFCR
jgi:hypothetical protein